MSLGIIMVICIMQHLPQYQSPPFCWRGQPSVPNFEKGGSEKNDCLGGLNESLPQIFPWGDYYVSFQKDFVKWNMVLRT